MKLFKSRPTDIFSRKWFHFLRLGHITVGEHLRNTGGTIRSYTVQSDRGTGTMSSTASPGDQQFPYTVSAKPQMKCFITKTQDEEGEGAREC